MAKAPAILVVDDFPDGREMVAEYLTFKGFEVLTAGNGDEAVRLAKRRRPDIILMDLQMPGTDGWQATRIIKSTRATKNIVVIAVTAHAFAKQESEAREAGCDGVIAKPFDITVLADRLRRVLKHGAVALDPKGIRLGGAVRTRKRPIKRIR